MMTSRTLAACLSLTLLACGDDDEGGGERPPPERAQAVRPGQPSTEVAEGRSTPGKPGATGKGGMLVTYAKVDDALYRIAFTPDMFQPDPVGDRNRDPFRSYLVDEAASATMPGKAAQSVDECEKRMVAEQFGLRDLNLVGIVKKGTTAYALFLDTQSFGHIARRGDCLSKDKARVKEIGQSSIIVEVRGDAPPGQPAPDPREEEWKLHPEQLELGAPRRSGQP